jgi:ketosteroid isomerase-like protein
MPTPSPGTNASIVREAFGAAERGDREAAFRLIKPDAAWQMIGLRPQDQRVHSGREEIWAYVGLLGSELDGLHWDLDAVEEIGDHVVARVRIRGRNRQTDEELEVEFSTVIRIEHGRIARADNFEDHDEAVCDAELRLGAAG